MNKVAIILVNYNGMEDTIECINSIKTIKNDYKVIVVDNNSNNNEADKIQKKFENVYVIKSNENLGFAGGNNLGIKYALEQKFENILLLNNDTIIDSKMIDKLLEYSNENTITVPKMYYNSNKNIIWYGGGKINKFTGRAIHIDIDKADENLDRKIKECTFATGCCIMLNRKIIEKIGLLSEEYFMYCEDTEYSLRALKNNIKILYVPEAKLWHKVSKSTGGSLSPFSVYYMTRNRFIYIKKYKKYFSKNAYWFTLFSRYVRIIQYWIKKNEIYKSIIKGIKDFNKEIVGKVDKYI